MLNILFSRALSGDSTLQTRGTRTLSDALNSLLDSKWLGSFSMGIRVQITVDIGNSSACCIFRGVELD